MIRSLGFHALSLALVAGPIAASAAIIDIDAHDGTATPTVVTLPAGDHILMPISSAEGGAYTGWSPWSSTVGCDEDGLNCTTGWINRYQIIVGDLPAVGYGTSLAYATPEQAFAEVEAATISLIEETVVQIFLSDVGPADNRGGMSFNLANAVPTEDVTWGAVKAIFGAEH